MTAEPGDARPTVVVADDEFHILEVLTILLEDLGVGVVAVANGDLALQAAAAVRPALVITDVMMPRMRGDELCRRIKADPALAGTPVVLLSAVSRPDLQEVGAEAFLGKPFDLDDVAALVHRYVRGLPAAT